MRPIVPVAALVFALSLACGKGPDDTTEADDTAAPTSSTQAGPTTSDPDQPVLEDCEAVCSFHATGDQFYIWSAGCTVTDPQGPDNISNLGDLDILQGDVVLATATLACMAGECTTSFREDQLEVEIGCTDPSAYDFRFVVYDNDGHVGVGQATGAGG